MTPIGNPQVTSPFGPRTSPISGKQEQHNGQDMKDAKGNLNLRAIWDTIKTECIQNYNNGRGYTAYLYFSNTLRALYQHCASFSPAVLAGKPLKQGDSVGTMGTTGDSTGVHLHIEVQVYSGGKWVPVEPSKYTEVPNTKGVHPGNDNIDGVTPAPEPTTGMVQLITTPLSEGDRKKFEELAGQLGVGIGVYSGANNTEALLTFKVALAESLHLSDTIRRGLEESGVEM